jgi:hypothetical protein
MSNLSTGPYNGTTANTQHDKERTWTDVGDLWDYTVHFKGLMPMHGCLRAKTKAQAAAFLKARHIHDEKSAAYKVEIHGKSKRYIR